MYDLNAFSKGYWDRAAAYLRNCARLGIYPVIQFWGECYVEGQPDGENRWNVHPFNAEFMFSSVLVSQTPAPTCVGRGKLLWQREFIGEPTRRSRAARTEAGGVCPPSS